MSVWSDYDSQLESRGITRRGVALKREQRLLDTKLPASLSYKPVTIDGEEQWVAITRSDNYDEKTIYSRPGEDLTHGGLVRFADNYWLITEKDPDIEVYARAKLVQCNYLLKWIEDGEIIERWCVVEDGTKYLTGETEDKNFILKLGDSRVSVTMTRDEHTAKLGRTNRFLIDDTDSPAVLAYRLTKPFKLGHTYNNKGVFSFVLQECETEESDNLELHIANYYDWFPRESDDEDNEDTDADEDSEDESGEEESTEEESTESTGRRVVI